MSDITLKYMDSVDRVLDEKLCACVNKGYEKLLEAMRYSVFAGGKRVRPSLTMAFCKACGGNTDNALDLAAAVEMIHTFSLIHDDLPEMDDDVLRRGNPTNHVVFGTGTALLAGDALVFSAISCCAASKRLNDAQKTDALCAIGKYCGLDGMIGGQQIDLQCEDGTLDGNGITAMYEGKTCALISLACLLGVIAADGDSVMRECAVNYGKALGMAFQINDDLLESPESDEGKATYVSAFGAERARAKAEECTEEAKKALSVLGEGAKEDLTEFCDLMLRRKK